MRPLLFFFIGLGFVIIVAVGVPMAVRGEITAGDFTAFILYLQRMIWYLIALGYVVNLYQRGTASLKRFNAILEAEPAIKDEPRRIEQPPVKGAIEFRDLTLPTTANRCSKILISRSSRARPSPLSARPAAANRRLLSLVPRLLDAPEGTVLVDGIPIREYPIAQLRRAIGFVPQETFLVQRHAGGKHRVRSRECRKPNGERGDKEITSGTDQIVSIDGLPLARL